MRYSEYAKLISMMQFSIADEKALENIVNRHPGPILEIGCWTGHSTSILAKDHKVICVDTFQGNGSHLSAYRDISKHIQAQFKLNMEACGCSDNITLIVGSSNACSGLFKNNSFDIIFIDGDHRYGQIMRDVNNYLPKTRHILCGHDLDSLEYDSRFIHQDAAMGVHHGVAKAIGVLGPIERFPDSSIWCYTKETK